VALAASTAAGDVTGILMAGVVATLGLLVIPARRRKAKAEIREKVTDLRQRLASALRIEFERATEQSRDRLARAVEPYSRFVRAEQSRWDQTRTTLASLRDKARSFREDLVAT
jgi:hypothetical protein